MAASLLYRLTTTHTGRARSTAENRNEPHGDTDSCTTGEGARPLCSLPAIQHLVLHLSSGAHGIGQVCHRMENKNGSCVHCRDREEGGTILSSGEDMRNEHNAGMQDPGGMQRTRSLTSLAGLAEDCAFSSPETVRSRP